MSLAKIAAALRAAAAVLESEVEEAVEAVESAVAAPKKGAKKATASAPTAATQAPATATAPAAVAAPAPPEAPTPVKYVARTGAKKGQTGTGIDAVNFAVLDLAAADRDKALGVLAKFKVSRTPELKAENFQAVIDGVEEELAKIDAASTQASLV